MEELPAKKVICRIDRRDFGRFIGSNGTHVNEMQKKFELEYISLNRKNGDIFGVGSEQNFNLFRKELTKRGFRIIDKNRSRICRHGKNCYMKECKFIHPQGRYIDDDDDFEKDLNDGISNLQMEHKLDMNNPEMLNVYRHVKMIEALEKENKTIEDENNGDNLKKKKKKKRKKQEKKVDITKDEQEYMHDMLKRLEDCPLCEPITTDEIKFVEISEMKTYRKQLDEIEKVILPLLLESRGRRGTMYYNDMLVGNDVDGRRLIRLNNDNQIEWCPGFCNCGRPHQCGPVSSMVVRILNTNEIPENWYNAEQIRGVECSHNNPTNELINVASRLYSFAITNSEDTITINKVAPEQAKLTYGNFGDSKHESVVEYC